MRRAVLRGLLAHKLRLALTGLAIVLGVGFVTGTLMVTDTMRSVFEDLFTDVAQGADLYVRSEAAFAATMGFSVQRETVPEALVDVVREVDGVAEAEGTVQGYAQLVRPDGEAVTTTGAPTLGVAWSDSPMSPLRLREGRAPAGEGEIAVDAATAARHGFEIGDRVQVLLALPAEQFTVVGVVGFGIADNLAGATLTVFETQTAQRVFDKQGAFDDIGVLATPGVDLDELASRLQTEIGSGYEVIAAEVLTDELTAEVAEGVGFFTVALLVFGAVAVFVGAFIIFNTFSIIVAQRTREFALLRALGASGRQVMGSVVAEAVLLGVLASAVGIGFGYVMAVGIRGLLEAGGMGLPTATFQLQPRTVLIGLAIGVGVTVASSILPGRRASRTPPVAAMREQEHDDAAQETGRALHAAPAVTLGLALMFAGLRGATDVPALLVGVGALATLLGAAIAAPVIARPVSRGIGWPFLKLFGISGKLARENASRNPKRTAATAAALMIGLALVSFVAIFAESSQAAADIALDEALGADFILTTGAAGVATGPMAPISTELAASLAARPELGAVSGVRVGQFQHDDQVHFLAAVDALPFSHLMDMGVTAGSMEALTQGGVLVHEEMAERLGVGIGDVLDLEFARTGVQALQIQGIFSEHRLIGSSFLISMQTYNANYSEPVDMLVLASTAAGVDVDTARAAVDAEAASYPNVTVTDQAEYRELARQNLNQLVALISALLGIAIVIALLGITNTLALSILERTREIGLLRAVGMSRRQVRNLIRWEAMVVALLGAALGLPIGLFFAWAVVNALADQGLGVFAAPWPTLAVYAALAGVAGVIAALAPARRAARLDVLRAVTVE